MSGKPIAEKKPINIQEFEEQMMGHAAWFIKKQKALQEDFDKRIERLSAEATALPEHLVKACVNHVVQHMHDNLPTE